MKKNRETDQLPLAGSEEGEILARLGERVEKAITTIQELRKERDSLRAKLEDAEARLRDFIDTSERASGLEEECTRYRTERSEIRSRIESILSNLESLEDAE